MSHSRSYTLSFASCFWRSHYQPQSPPQSCDLTPLDYCLWGAVKDKCYANKPETIDALKDNIREAISEIQLHTIDNVLKNWTDHVGYCMASRGNHLNEIVSIIKRKDCTFKYKQDIFLKAFSKKKYLADPVLTVFYFEYFEGKTENL